MLFNKEIESLHDDGFEGSVNEGRIFTEVFFGNDRDTTSKRCFVKGVINCEFDYNKHRDILPRSNSENSAMISQVDSSNLKENLKENSVRGCSSEGCALFTRIDPVGSGKRRKLSADELSSEPFQGGASKFSAPLKGVFSGMSQPALHSLGHDVICRLVESSSQGVTTSCYLLKRRAETQSGGKTGDRNSSKSKLKSLNGSIEKEVDASKAIASPVSQESSAAKLLTASPHVTVAITSRSGLCAEDRKKPFNSQELPVAKKLVSKDSMKDPRPLLRNHIQNLLRAAGWEIGRRKREDNIRGEYIYLSPWGGRPIRDFRRVWNLCGQSLFADRNILVKGDDKQWIDMTHFWSDLSNTCVMIEEEFTNKETTIGLAHQWFLLDPFANMVFIDKKLATLRAGEVVRARRSLVIDTSVKEDDVLALEYVNTAGNQSKGPRTDGPSGSSAVRASASTVSEAIYHICNDEYHDGSSAYFRQCQKEPVKLLMGAPDSLLKEKCISSTSITSRTGAQCMVFSGNKRSRQGLNSFQACGSDGTSKHFVSCLEVPTLTENANIMQEGSEIVSLHHDHSALQGCGKYKNCIGDGLTKAISLTNGKISRSQKNTFICAAELKSGKKQSRFRKFYKNSGSCKKPNHLSSKMLNFRSITTEVPLQVQNELLHHEFMRKDVTSEEPETRKVSGQKRSNTYQLKDDDLLISAIIKNKPFGSTTKRFIQKWKSCKSGTLRKRKSQKGSCRLLLRSWGKVGKHIEGKWFIFGPRTVLSWLIHSGVVSLKEVIQYRSPNDDEVVKVGVVTRDGIFCKCCNKVFSVSGFKIHAGFMLNRPCLNIFMESGKPFTLCQLEAWSAEYKARRNATRAVVNEATDHNDDSCGLCGDGGELICCDNCPSTFHQACLYAQELPEGSWYCPHCTCRICGAVVNDKEPSMSPGALKCSQCEHKYHEACLKEKNSSRIVASHTWFCGESCQEVYLGLHSHIGFVHHLSDGFSWTLLRCIHDDQRVHSAQIALKAECNSKLAVALTIMEECFLSMVDPRTGIDMIPHVLYNWGSEFARLNFGGFYTAVLEKDDVLVSVASIRIHGVRVAEMPLIATCSKYRRQGMCRRLMNSIEEMLTSLGVEKLVISAIPSLVETWTVGFGFKLLEDDERKGLSNINLMVLPGTVWLKKPIHQYQKAHQLGSSHELPLMIEYPAESGICSQGGPTVGSKGQSIGSSLVKEVGSLTEIRRTESNHIDINEGDTLRNQFSNLCCEQRALTVVEDSQLEMESVVMSEEREPSSNEQSLKPHVLEHDEK